MRLKDIHAIQIDPSEMDAQDDRPKRDHRSGKKTKGGAGGASKNYKKRLNELKEGDAQDCDY